MKKTKNVLIVGGGIGGMSAALELHKHGLNVQLIDIDPGWKVYGAGITITGPTLRAFKAIDILDEVIANAYTGDGIEIRNTQGNMVSLVATPPTEDPTVPRSGGIMRPTLHKILANRIRERGIPVKLGLTVDALENHTNCVTVHFSNRTSAQYDLVIGADGVFSKVRELIFPDTPKPEYTGQSCWRLVAPRPSTITRRTFFLGGKYKVGLSPVSDTEMYMFLLETGPRHPLIPDAKLSAMLADRLSAYGGELADIRRSLNPDARIVMRPLEAFFLPSPWYSGRTLLIGDAAHPTTPQLASGAGMAVEDAIVLRQELSKENLPLEEVFENFMRRRYARCRLVVENSIEIGRREQRGASAEEQTKLVEESLTVLAMPI